MRTIVTHFLLSFCQHLYNVEYNYRSQINGDGKGWYGEEEATELLENTLVASEERVGEILPDMIEEKVAISFLKLSGNSVVG